MVNFEYLRTLLKCMADTLVYVSAAGAVDSDGWFQQPWIRLLGLGGFYYESKTRHSQSMNNFLLDANSEYSVNWRCCCFSIMKWIKET
jgi:hypothetical protein